MIIITLLVAIPTISVSVGVYLNNKKNVDRQIENIIYGNITNTKNITDTILRTTDLLAVQTSLNKDVQNFFLSMPDNNRKISNTYQKIREYISGYTSIYPYIHSIYIYSEKLGTVIQNQEVVSLEDHTDKGWLHYYKDKTDQNIMIIPRKVANFYPCFISIIKPVMVDNYSKIGCVVINIDAEQLYSIISDLEEGDSNAILFDKNNKILLSNDLSRIGNDLTDLLPDVTLKNITSSSFGHLNVDQEKVMYAQKASSRYGLTYLLTMPETSFNNVALSTFRFLIPLVSLALLLGFLISLFISIKTYTPLQQIMDVLLTEPSNEPYNNKNELTFIIDAITSTINKKDDLVVELNYKMLLLKEAQAYALQSQINPHFLNNTLDSINWSAISSLGEDNKISKMIKFLSRFLDISLDSKHYLVTINEELQHTNIYIYIMQLNYGSNINFKWDFEEGISQHQILKTSLQPILENAITHGLAPKNYIGEIATQGRFYNDEIVLTITDDGVGIPSKELSKLQEELNKNIRQGKHIGLKNVNQRIKLVFGDQYGISVSSREGKGTTITLRIPKTTL